MPKRSSGLEVDRRAFMTAVAAGAATSVATAGPAVAAGEGEKSKAPKGAAPPSAHAKAAETTPPPDEAIFVARSGSDFMVDVIKRLGFDYVAAMPGSSFRGLHESLINYGGNKKPELLTCLHEEASVAIAHGYAKAAGRPMAVLAHGTVGLQHASMAVYNAWCDRVPVVIIGGNTADATKRRPGVEWLHSVQDGASLLRDFTKWDDQPLSLAHFSESAMRAYKIAVTPPMAPVLLMVDSEMQERPVEEEPSTIPRLAVPTPPVGDPRAIAEAAKLLAAAERPVIIADRLARTPEGMRLLVEFAETLQAPVVDKYGRMNMPTDHYLNHSGRGGSLVRQADVIIGLEMVDFFGAVNTVRDIVYRDDKPIAKPSAKLISVGVGDLYLKANYQDFERYQFIDIDIAGDGEATLPSLIEATKRAIGGERRSALQARGEKLKQSYAGMCEQAREDATYGWDASPVSTARLCAELWMQIKDGDWSLVSDPMFQSYWPQRLWAFNKHDQFIGGPGGYGVGYGAPAAVGAALAHRGTGRVVVSLQGDGDLMCSPGVLWTAAHHKIPLLTIMHNNRAYHQEVMHVQRIADRHARGIDRVKIGTTIDEPGIDYAKLAQSMGMWSVGPIADPKDLAPALKRAVEVVRRGEPAMVDVVCQPR